jgi:hypothetical protein
MKDTHFAGQGIIKVATKVQLMQLDISLEKGYMEEIKSDLTAKHLSFFFINNAPNVQQTLVELDQIIEKLTDFILMVE